MNLATRCSDCGTVFRVVPDQLKVSEGWVRCGRCNAVFNAEEHLVDLEATDGGAASPPHEVPASPLPPPASSRSPGVAPDIGLATPEAGHPPAPVGAEPPSATPADWQPDLPSDLGSGTNPTAAPAGGGFDPALADEAASGAALSITPAEPAVRIDADEAVPTPSFLREAHGGEPRAARVAAGVSAGIAAVLALALVVQLALGWRDELAARLPALRDVLAAACAPFDCTIAAPRRITELTVESSGLARIDGAAVHRLTVALRNRADTAALAPAIELALTDAQGALIARKVIAVADFGQTVQAIEPGGELALQAVIGTGDRRVAGYAVEIFYP